MHRVGLGDGRTAVSYGWTYCQQENRLIQSFGGNWSIVVKIRKCGSRSHISPLNKRQHLGDNFVIYDNIGSWEGGRGGGWLKLCFWRTYLSAVFRHTWINSRWLFFPSIWGTRWWDFTVLVSCPHVISVALVHPLLLLCLHSVCPALSPLLSIPQDSVLVQHPPRPKTSSKPPGSLWGAPPKQARVAHSLFGAACGLWTISIDVPFASNGNVVLLNSFLFLYPVSYLSTEISLVSRVLPCM